MITKQRATIQDHIYVALRSLNDQIFARIRALDGPNLLMETQPGSSNDVSPRAMALPLPAHQARWIFSLLLFLDDYLPPSDLADLRGIAKTCLRIVRWQVTSHTYVSADAQKDQTEQEDMRTSCWIIHRAASRSEPIARLAPDGLRTTCRAMQRRYLLEYRRINSSDNAIIIV